MSILERGKTKGTIGISIDGIPWPYGGVLDDHDGQCTDKSLVTQVPFDILFQLFFQDWQALSE
ncbi:hypothetical protein SMI01S_16140 [Sphingobacterium mizutaii NBRC 14946 = DSM 11724]|uniref:Uncharacterized protein n=1 Tax=Sphingobacterium mizutaii NBRC 14946 = DSM 11724 TaxID=1220576 RepID=A0ABQ0W237_9SPHI|nr:hypothetical protein SMI01S_16140 [Sphingobacterium mizutaii NBRC 14946 = DSM 11724]